MASITLPISPSFLLQSPPLKPQPLPSTTSSTQSRARKVSQESYQLNFFYSSRLRYQFSRRHSFDIDDEDGECSFDEAVFLFNRREYYRCHDFLEALWNKAEEPRRTLIHGILQCAVGFHHLFNQNHRGAMMELGEGLCKLRKMNFESGPFHQFEQEIAAVLDFIYQTQIELAAWSRFTDGHLVLPDKYLDGVEIFEDRSILRSSGHMSNLSQTELAKWQNKKNCKTQEYLRVLLNAWNAKRVDVNTREGSDDFCLTMDGSERSYQLLGGFASGKHLYGLKNDQNDVLYIIFCPEESYIDREAVKVKVPTLHATEEHLMECTYG